MKFGNEVFLSAENNLLDFGGVLKNWRFITYASLPAALRAAQAAGI